MKYCTLFVIILSFCFSSNGYANIDSHAQAINESGRLRMLTQRIAKAYLLIAMDVQPEKAKAQLGESIQIFDDNLDELNVFSNTLANALSLKNELKSITNHWQEFKSALKLKDSTTIASERVLTLSDNTLLACEALVNSLEKTASDEASRLVNISGRQRMLSQRIAKLYSAISLTGNARIYDEGLQQAIKEFDLALKTLINSPNNTHFLKHKLKKVSTQWAFSKKGFESLQKGESTPLIISMTTESILKQMNDITALYEDLGRKSNRAPFRKS